MSAPIHTPAPWRGGSAATVLSADGRTICRMAVRFDETEVADWYLVIAAPQLLRALEALAGAAAMTPNFASPLMLKGAFEAIALAKGEKI